MRALFTFALLALLTLLATGCAEEQSPREVRADPSYYVPTTAMISRPEAPLNAYALLPASDADLDFPRGEKGVYGALSIASYSAYTTYSFDPQRIGTRDSYGYRYRWVVQEGISAPVAP